MKGPFPSRLSTAKLLRCSTEFYVNTYFISLIMITHILFFSNLESGGGEKRYNSIVL